MAFVTLSESPSVFKVYLLHISKNISKCIVVNYGYNDGQRTNANSASAALNKWLKGKISEGYTMHSFRHSMRDRLRAVECPSDIIDQIGGWLTLGVGNIYGEGYPVNILAKQMAEACINTLACNAACQ